MQFSLSPQPRRIGVACRIRELIDHEGWAGSYGAMLTSALSPCVRRRRANHSLTSVRDHPRIASRSCAPWRTRTTAIPSSVRR